VIDIGPLQLPAYWSSHVGDRDRSACQTPL